MQQSFYDLALNDWHISYKDLDRIKSEESVEGILSK